MGILMLHEGDDICKVARRSADYRKDENEFVAMDLCFLRAPIAAYRRNL